MEMSYQKPGVGWVKVSRVAPRGRCRDLPVAPVQRCAFNLRSPASAR